LRKVFSSVDDEFDLRVGEGVADEVCARMLLLNNEHRKCNYSEKANRSSFAPHDGAPEMLKDVSVATSFHARYQSIDVNVAVTARWIHNTSPPA
jgi:hypothetical protein